MSELRACRDCLYRSWLVQCLGARFDVRRYDTQRLATLLALPGEELLAALGVENLAQLEARYGGFGADSDQTDLTGRWPSLTICRHDRSYRAALHSSAPAEISAWAAPAVLRAAGDLGRLRELAAAPAVAVVGSRRATDYGLEVAGSLARDLAHAGLTVLSGLADGIASAAHAGALEGGGTTVTVMPSGVDVCVPPAKRSLYEGILEHGCAISEMPFGAQARRWTYAARNRIIAGLARLLVVVEAEERPCDLMLARFARTLGRTVVAVPGRVTSAASQGTHALIASGAGIVRDAQDILDALYGVATRHTFERTSAANDAQASKEQSRILTLVAGGADTPARLGAKGLGIERALVALSELELRGSLIRGDGGRYLPSTGRPKRGGRS
jgi:DNA processing protein